MNCFFTALEKLLGRSPRGPLHHRRRGASGERLAVAPLERSLTRKRTESRARAQAIAALSIGGMVVARTLLDRAHADQLRKSCLQMALRLGGWQHRKQIPRARSFHGFPS